jgi:hypothetical protein
MRLLPLFLLSSVLICGEAQAQQIDGYAFFAPGGVSPSLDASSRRYQIGGGFEGIFAHGIGAGAEIGAMGKSLTHSVFGLFSVNGYYHFRPHRKIDPFATAGYSLEFGLSGGGPFSLASPSTANLFNYGFGANYWFRGNLGLKAEFRDYLWPAQSANTNYWGFQFGLAFRRK